MGKDLDLMCKLGGIISYPSNDKSAGILVDTSERVERLLILNEEQRKSMVSTQSERSKNYIDRNDNSKKSKKERKIRLYSNLIEFLDYDWGVVGGSSSRKSYVLYKDNIEIFRTNFRTPYGSDVSLVKQMANLKELFEKIIELEEVK